MNLSSHVIVKAPVADVYAAMTQFETFEVMLENRGATIERVGNVMPPEAGARWQSTFTWRSREFNVQAELVSIEPGANYAVESTGNGLTCFGVVDLQKTPSEETLLFVSFEFSATTFASKLLLQTLRFSARSLNSKLDQRLEALARRIEIKG